VKIPVKTRGPQLVRDFNSLIFWARFQDFRAYEILISGIVVSRDSILQGNLQNYKRFQKRFQEVVDPSLKTIAIFTKNIFTDFKWH